MSDQPCFDLDNPVHRRAEAFGVLENILQGMIGTARDEVKKGRKPPKASAYARLLLSDLEARSFSITSPEFGTVTVADSEALK